jgi:hypothetical protein
MFVSPDQLRIPQHFIVRKSWFPLKDPQIFLLLLILLVLTQARHAEQCRTAKNDKKDD